MFLQQLQKLQSQGMGPMGGGGSSGSSGGGSSSGFGGGGTNTGWGGGGTTSGRESTGFSGGFSGGDWGSSSFGSSGGSTSSGFNSNAFGSLSSANQAAVAKGSDATSSVSTSGRGNTDSRRGDIASTARSSFAATAPAASRFGELAGTTTFGGPQSSLADTGLAQSPAQQSSDRSNEMGMANVGFSDRMNTSQMVDAMAGHDTRFTNSLPAKALSMVSPAVTVARGLHNAHANTVAQNSVRGSLGTPQQSYGRGMASNLASPVGGYLGGQAGGLIGGQIGADLGGLPGAVVGTVGGALGGQTLGSNMAQGIVDGRGSTVGGGVMGSLGNAAGINMGGGSDNNQSLLGTGMQAQSQQPANQPQGNAYGWQGYDSSFGNYGSHNSQFVGNPNRARNAFR